MIENLGPEVIAIWPTAKVPAQSHETTKNNQSARHFMKETPNHTNVLENAF